MPKKCSPKALEMFRSCTHSYIFKFPLNKHTVICIARVSLGSGAYAFLDHFISLKYTGCVPPKTVYTLWIITEVVLIKIHLIYKI